ncbi:uncharacterized protein LOC115229124 [Octopus sinensis]|uniref:Uncharacterized protein LOC115229124 n=1 Tax=Octopus sinensis TaxID=2607531 RepID=A0A6P7U3D2_9MOLL|nr:uncharacterized protein LOC115229124 [Octopus sinensis]
MFAESEDLLVRMMSYTNEFLEASGMENFEKSATNSMALGDEACVFDGLQGYRYLGIIENKSSEMKKYLQSKYGEEYFSGVPLKQCLGNLINLQETSLMTKIKGKNLHFILFNSQNLPNVDHKSSSIWLANGNNSPRNEGLACFLQYRNIFFSTEELVSRCPHCKAAKKTVDHLATRCERMLYLDYTRRHNEVVRCLHLHFCRLYGLKNQKRLKTHLVQEVISNERVEIRVDTRIETDSTIRYNKPDLLVYDKKENVIWIVEVGVTSQDNLQRVELEKLRKYDLLANELSLIHKAKVNIIPVVLTWDGIVSKYFKIFGLDQSEGTSDCLYAINCA